MHYCGSIGNFDVHLRAEKDPDNVWGCTNYSLHCGFPLTDVCLLQVTEAHCQCEENTR